MNVQTSKASPEADQDGIVLVLLKWRGSRVYLESLLDQFVTNAILILMSYATGFQI